MKTLIQFVSILAIIVLVNPSTFAQDCVDGQCRLPTRKVVQAPVQVAERLVEGTVKVATAPVRVLAKKQPVRKVFRRVFCR